MKYILLSFKNIKILLTLLFVFSLISCSSVPKNTNNLELVVNLNITNTDVITRNDIRKSILKSISLLRYKKYTTNSIENMEMMYDRSVNEIKNITQGYGYYSPIVTSKIDHENKNWTIDFNINLNEPVIVTNFILNTYPTLKNEVFNPLMEDMPLKVGSILKEQEYEDSKTYIINSLYDDGYLDVFIDKKEILLDKQTYDASVMINVNTGKLYKIGNVNLKQTGFQLRPDFITKFLTFKTEKTFSQNDINKTLSNLQKSPSMDSVSLNPLLNERDKVNHNIDIDVELSSINNKTYSFGVGYGTFTGPRITSSAVFKHLTDSGHYLSANLLASPINTTFSVDYFIPGNNPLNERTAISAQQSLFDVIAYTALQTKVGTSYSNLNNEYFDFNIGLFQNYIFYNTQANSDNDSDFYLTPSISFKLNLLSSDGFWKQGIVINNLTEGAIKGIASTGSFFKNTTSIQFTIPIIHNWTRFVSYNNLGVISTDDILSLAAPYRYYVGGINSLLGFAYLSEGPRGSNGGLIGGKYLATTRFGIEQRVYGKISALFYYNMGNSANKIDFSDVMILQSASVGASYSSPIGQLQAFVSRTFKSEDNYFRFDINIGTDF